MSGDGVIAVDGARVRLFPDAPSLAGLRTVALGEFDCEDAEAGAAVLRRAVAAARAEGYAAALGPMDGDTWRRHRLVVESDGRPPFLMEPSNPAHHPAAFELAGLAVVSRYVSAARPATPPDRPGAAPAEVSLRGFRPADARRELAAIHALSLKAFAGNAFYKPIALDAFLDSYRPVLPMLDHELVLLAETAAGDLAGFLFAIPDYAEGPAPRSVILKTYASTRKGVGSLLAARLHQTVADRGFSTVIHALMHEDNLSVRHSDNTGAAPFRRYALWGARL